MFLKTTSLLFLILLPLYFILHQNQLSNNEQTGIQGLSLSIDDSIKFTPLSIDKIFSEDHTWTATLAAERKRILIATGDILLARTVNYKTVTTGNFIWPFEKTADVLRNADITFINLENPLVENCPLTNEGMKFCGDPRNIEGLLFAGVDIVNIANNHAGNYGLEGVEETVNFLTNAGLVAVGISGPVYKDVRGVKFAFLGYNEVNYQEGISLASEEVIASEVSRAKSNADVVIVQFHWGNEYTTDISQNQRLLAHLAIDSGADLVIGNHPHWIQPLEIYKDKLITYAHGNFVFDQMWSLKTREGVIGKYTFYDSKLIDIEFIPIQISDFGQPNFIDDSLYRKKIIDDMRLESISL